MNPLPSLRRRVIRPACDHLGLWSQAAENLLWGTANYESELLFLEQQGGGPALGLWQIEPATRRDLYDRWLTRRPHLREKLRALVAPVPKPEKQLATNLMYACAVARLIYYRRPEPLPHADDIEGLAAYWKQWYNTPAGAGSAARWVLKYRKNLKEIGRKE